MSRSVSPAPRPLSGAVPAIATSPTCLVGTVAVHVTVDMPSGNSAGALLVTVGEKSHTSVAVASPSDTAVPTGAAHSALRGPGAVMLGGSVSTILNCGERLKKMLPIAAT